MTTCLRKQSKAKQIKTEGELVEVSGSCELVEEMQRLAQYRKGRGPGPTWRVCVKSTTKFSTEAKVKRSK